MTTSNKSAVAVTSSDNGHFNTSKDTLCPAAGNTKISPSNDTWGFDPAPIWAPLHKACPELPPEWPGLSERHQQELAEGGITPEQACREAIFTATPEQAKALTGYWLPGLIFPYWKPQAEPESYSTPDERPFCRIKPDWLNAGEQARQAFRDKDGKLPKYLSPKGAGVLCYFPRCVYGDGIPESSKTALIIEGEKSALAAALNGYTVIGLGGIWNFKANDGLLGGVRPWEWQRCKTVICPDSDILFNDDVRAAVQSFARTVAELTFEEDPYSVASLNDSLQFLPIPAELNGAKNGVDDFIYRHGLDGFKLLMDNRLPLVHCQSKADKREKKPTPELIFQCLYTREPSGDDTGKHHPRYASRTNRGAQMAALLKDSIAHRPDVATYRYSQGKGIWEVIAKEEYKAIPTDFCNAQGWKNHTSGLLAEQQAQLDSRVFVPNEAWDNPRFMAFENGVLDLSSDEMMPFHPKYRLTSRLGFNREKGATCPTWQTFGQQTFPEGNQFKLLQAIFRVIMQPKSAEKYGLELMVGLQGKPGVGKGIILNILMRLLGESSYATFKKSALESPEGCFGMLGKKASINLDLKGRLTEEAIETLNQMASNEPIMVRSLYKNGDTTRLNTIPVVAFNEMPRIAQDAKDGLSRRLLTLELKHIPKVVDMGLAKKLEAELPGIFEWAWSMPLDVAEDLIQSARTSREMRESHIKYLEETNSVYLWLKEDKPCGTSGIGIKAKELYLEYSDFCKEMGSGAFKFSNFKKELDKAGAIEKREGGVRVLCIPKIDDVNVAHLMGIYAAPQEPMPEPTPEPEAVRVLAEAMAAIPDVVGWNLCCGNKPKNLIDAAFLSLPEEAQQRIRAIVQPQT